MAEDNRDSYNRRNQVQIDLEEYEAKNAKIGALKDEIQKMKDAAGPNKMGWLWLAPEYFSDGEYSQEHLSLCTFTYYSHQLIGSWH